MRRGFGEDPPRIVSLEVAHCSETFRVALRRCARARRFTLRVKAATGDVVLTVPIRAGLDEAERFAQRHAAWIGARLGRLSEPRRFEAGESVPLRGCLHKIVYRPGARGTVWIEPSDSDGAGEGMPLLCVNGDAPFIARRVQDFLMREARRDLELAIARHAKELGVQPRKVALRDTTSRWGSCSASGSLSFSWRLIMAPGFVLDYLAAHEVAHMRHMNHSPAFWKVVAALTPHAGRAEAWLRAHGSELLRFGRGVNVRAEAQVAEVAGAPEPAATSSRRLR